MANRRVSPEKKRIPIMVTVQKDIVDLSKMKAEENDVSFSNHIENLLKADIEGKCNVYK